MEVNPLIRLQKLHKQKKKIQNALKIMKMLLFGQSIGKPTNKCLQFLLSNSYAIETKKVTKYLLQFFLRCLSPSWMKSILQKNVLGYLDSLPEIFSECFDILPR